MPKQKNILKTTTNHQPIPVSILFADVKGFSSLDTRQLVKYVEIVIPELQRLILKSEDQILHVNTWGDGLFILSRDALFLAELALDIRDYFRNHNFANDGLPNLKIRIALHHAQVIQFSNFMQLTQHNKQPVYEYIGTQVNIASRIEPVTPPNHIWATNAFKEILIGTGNMNPAIHLDFEDVGFYPLAKNAGKIHVFHLRRKADDAPSPRPASPIWVSTLEAATNKRFTERLQRLAQCQQGEEVHMIAITGRGALLPINNERFDIQPIPSAIKRGVKLKVIVLDPNSPEAIFRSDIESGVKTPLPNRLLQRDANEIEISLLDLYNKLLEMEVDEIKARLEIGRTSIGVGFSLWLFSDIAFMDPHHFGKETAMANLCHFATTIIPSGNREYDLLNRHFNALWNTPETVKLW